MDAAVCFANLSDRPIFRLTGADRVRYLNGQITNDLHQLKEGRTLYACLLTAKGKLCADIYVAREPDALRIDGPPTLRDELAARLEKYIVADDVQLVDESDNLALIHLLGGTVAIPDQVIATAQSNRFGVEGTDLVVERSTLSDALTILSQKIPILSSSELQLLRIKNGIPEWDAELTPDRLPNEAGLETKAIDYNKGCYIGQEVISRIKSIGHVNRRLVRLNAPGQSLQPADLIIDAASQQHGEITSVAKSPDSDECLALGYLKRGAPESNLFFARPAQPGSPIAPVQLR